MVDNAPVSNSPKSGPSSTVKLGALLIIGLMLLSGVAIYFAGQNAGTDPNNPNPNAPAMKSYRADELEGTVTDVFPSAIVGGSTSVSDKTELDEAILALPNVKGVDSQFTQLNPTDSRLTYLANVSLKEGVDKSVFVMGVQSLSSLQNPEIYFQAAVSINPVVSVVDESEVESQLTIPTSIIQGIVSPETQVGNVISGQFAATYQGTQLVSAYLLETQNISLAPTPISTEGTFVLSSLQPQLSIAGSFSYWDEFSEEELVNGMGKINGVQAVLPPLIPAVGNTLKITVEDADLMGEDFNAFILAHAEKYPGLTLVSDGFVVQLGNVSLEMAKTELTQAVFDSAAANVPLTFTDPFTQFWVDVNVSTDPTQNVEKGIQSYFDAWPVDVNVEIYQSGFVDVNTLEIPDMNQPISVPEGVIPVSVNPGHSIGDSIFIQINGILVNNALVYVNGIESVSVN